MTTPLSDDTLEYALEKYFVNPIINRTQFFKLGRENTTVLVEGNFGTVVLRVWGELHSRMGARTDGDIQDELAFMQACREQQLPIPKIYISKVGRNYSELADGRKFSIMDYVPGQEPTNFTPPMIEELATTIAQMNTLSETFVFPAPRTWQGDTIEVVQERIKEYQALNSPDAFVDYLVERLQKQLAQIDITAVPRGPIHGDIMYQNIKYDGQHLSGIFDFDDCREGYLIEDIAKTLYFVLEDPTHAVLGDDIHNAKLFLDAYQCVRPLNDAETRALPTLSLARFICDLLKFYLHGATRPNAAEIRVAKQAAYYKFKPLFEEPLPL